MELWMSLIAAGSGTRWLLKVPSNYKDSVILLYFQSYARFTLGRFQVFLLILHSNQQSRDWRLCPPASMSSHCPAWNSTAGEKVWAASEDMAAGRSHQGGSTWRKKEINGKFIHTRNLVLDHSLIFKMQSCKFSKCSYRHFATNLCVCVNIGLADRLPRHPVIPFQWPI